MIQQLTPNFSLDEMLKSPTASRKGFSEQFNPPATVIDSLTVLCVRLLQPIRDAYGKPMRVSSGYRCLRLNRVIGGAPKSQHLTGEAADLDMGSREANQQLFEFILDLHKKGLIEFDQLINEYNFAWVHISFKRTGINRNQVLTVA